MHHTTELGCPFSSLSLCDQTRVQTPREGMSVDSLSALSLLKATGLLLEGHMTGKGAQIFSAKVSVRSNETFPARALLPGGPGILCRRKMPPSTGQPLTS